MYEILTNGHFVFWGAVTLMVIVPTLAYTWSAVRRTEIEANLKRDMVARGMSADEIQRVLQASSAKEEE